MKEMPFKDLEVGAHFKVSLDGDAVIHRKCTSTAAQIGTGQPFPVHPNNVVWQVDSPSVSSTVTGVTGWPAGWVAVGNWDTTPVPFRDIVVGEPFFYESNWYRKADSNGAYNMSNQYTKADAKTLVRTAHWEETNGPSQAPAAAVGVTPLFTINLTEKGYRKLTEDGAVPASYMGNVIKIGPIGRSELTVGLIVDAWIEWREREISAIEDRCAKEAEAMVHDSFENRYVWTQCRYEEMCREIREVDYDVSNAIHDIIAIAVPRR